MGSDSISPEMEKCIRAINTWLKTQYHLPQHIHPVLLQRFIHSCDYDIEKVKKLIDVSFTMRNTYKNIFIERDPTSEASKLIYQATDQVPLPLTTKENYKILFYRLADLDADKFNFTEAIKVFFMIADVRMAMLDNGKITDGEIPIFDMKGYSLKHLTKTVLSTLRCYMKYTQEAHPVKLRQIHVINCSPFLDRILMLVKPFIKSEVFKLIRFHLPDSDTLDEYVPKDLLPEEYGGKQGSLAKLKADWIQYLHENRSYLMGTENWKVDEKKRNYGNSNVNNEELNGNFKNLCVD